jgi:hypothetical protein
MQLGIINTYEHFQDCVCCNCLGHVPTANEVVKVYKYESPRNVFSNQFHSKTMSGSVLEDIVGGVAHIFEEIAKIAHAIIGSIVKTIERAIIAIAKVIREIDWKAVGKFMGEVYGYILVNLNPAHLAWEFLKAFPLTSHLAKQLDELTGGLFTTLDNLSTLAGRALRGDPISKAELFKDCLFCIKLAVAFFAGPVGWVAFAAGQLKQGTLGKTALGRDILSIIEIAGYAYVAGSAIYDAATDKATDLVMQNAQADALRNIRTGDPTLDAFLVGATFAAGTAAYNDASMYDSFLGFSGTFAENTAITELAGRIGGPLAKDIATGVVKGVKDGEFDPSKIDYTSVPQGYSLSQFADDLNKLGSNIKESFLTFVQTPSGSFALPQFTIDLELPNLTMPDSILLPSLPDVNLSMPSLSAPRIEFPELTMPSISWDMGDWNLEGGRRSKKRKTKVRGTNGKLYTVYLLEDGSIYYVEEANYLMWAMIGGGVLLLSASA